MSAASVVSLSGQLASALYRNMSELVRTCAIYLGIAVLVATAMVASMPDLRVQAFQMHGALLYALAPDAFGPPPSAIRTAPIAPLVSAISLDMIPGDVLPAPPPILSPGKVVSRAGTLLIGKNPPEALLTQDKNAPEPTLNKNVDGSGNAIAKATEAAGTTLVQTSAQAMQKFGISVKQKDALIQYLSRKYLIAVDAAGMFVDTAYVLADEFNLDPLLLLSVVGIESHFNPYAGGQAGGATGLMQIMFTLHREKFAKFGRPESMAFNPVANMRVGAFILSDCVRRRGSITQGLLCYNGAASTSSDRGYTDKVLSERRRLALAGSIAIKD